MIDTVYKLICKYSEESQNIYKSICLNVCSKCNHNEIIPGINNIALEWFALKCSLYPKLTTFSRGRQ